MTHTIAHRLARYLERLGLLVRDAENSYLALEGLDEDPMDQLRGNSITYRIALGPQQGRKVFTLRTLPDERDADETPASGNVAGLLRVSCPPPFGPACGCSKSLPAILSPCTPV